ncbi:hypothetical protein [Thiohalobacter thiocyanaticus]|uniref:Uncharacterized protein n=1 Tax=Thiohalobacter thiocyanaticus TaxID=585455 RepID=A0A426QHV0_9GAMM|nr:hypothetical protein [Thiohalobacter thiocyanaticus]RRQ21322.1 hypothetical protein D6C00_04775 [Thiohalobacter thiocyanaticus]
MIKLPQRTTRIASLLLAGCIISPSVIAIQPQGTPGGTASSLSKSYLNGDFEGWGPNGLLRTSVGDYETNSIYVEDKAGTRNTTEPREPTPRVRLEFVGDTLTRITIY